MSIIVTGGAGLIGSAIIYELNRRNFTDIIVVDHIGNSEKWKNLVPLKYSDYYEKDDFKELLMSGFFEEFDIKGVIHMGACSSTTETNGSYLVDNNFNYSKELALFAIEKKARFVYASSCATYGDGSMGYCDNDAEIEKLRPLNMYGYSKQMFDLWAKNLGILNKITGCKFSNVYGPNEYHKDNMRSVVIRAFEQIKSTGTMKLFKSYRSEYSDGEQMRDFLYVKDAADMVLFLYDNPKATGLYNIGSGRAETWNALTLAAFQAMNKEPKIEYIDMPESLKGKYQYYTKAEMDKLKNLGYTKEPMSLEDAVKDYIQNYLALESHLEP